MECLVTKGNSVVNGSLLNDSVFSLNKNYSGCLHIKIIGIK